MVELRWATHAGAARLQWRSRKADPWDRLTLWGEWCDVPMHAVARAIDTPPGQDPWEWQPIETAPKSGRHPILLWTPGAAPRVACVDTWRGKERAVGGTPAPTHWMPLSVPTQQEPVTWGVDWARQGDRSCVSILKRHSNGVVEIVATEYEPEKGGPA